LTHVGTASATALPWCDPLPDITLDSLIHAALAVGTALIVGAALVVGTALIVCAASAACAALAARATTIVASAAHW
jgi:hypothetical protein